MKIRIAPPPKRYQVIAACPRAMGAIWVFLGISAMVFAWALGAYVLYSSPTRRLNRRLAFLLFAEGAGVGTTGIIWASPSADVAWTLTLLHAATDVVVIVAYLLFIAVALQTPLVSWLRPWPVQAAIVLAGLATLALMALRPLQFVADGLPFPLPWFTEYFGLNGPWWPHIWTAMTVTFAFGLVSAIHAWSRANTPTARQQGRAYTMAFGTQDIVWASVFAYLSVLDTQDPLWFVVVIEAYTVVTFVYVALIAYGLLKAQLFDIDLKVKFVLSRSAVAGAIAVSFVVVTESLESILPFDSTLAGLAAAGGLALAFGPLEQRARRVADRLMPGVTNDPAYLHRRKGEVYMAAVESALFDGQIEDDERRFLERFRERLGLDAAEAGRLEALAARSHQA